LLCWLTYHGKNASKSLNSRVIALPPLDRCP
jgi:hypothetical protein